jgi:LPS export ABC transporter permease LptF
MKHYSWRISRYILASIAPYFAFTWLLLSVILFVQQGSRYSDIFFNTTLPAGIVWQLTFALIPNVIAFTCPMAVLLGVIIGLSKMQGDSELVAIRAAGVGNFQISLPIVVLGLLLSLFAFFINIKGVPFAAQIVRKVAVETALFKLRSPIEPGTFNSEVKGYTFYIKDGDLEKGTWKNVFIYNEDKDKNQVRLITSVNGKIDSNDTDSELVLDNASINTFSTDNLNQKLVFESVNNLRLVIPTKRKELIDKMSNTEELPEELGLRELLRYAKSKIGKERTEAEILFQRRIILSITPLIFALLGASLVLRFNRGGRGWGIFLALVSLVGYYLVALVGEQLARSGGINVFISSLFPIILTSGIIFWFFLSQRLNLTKVSGFFQKFNFSNLFNRNRSLRRSSFVNLTTGILDYDIVSSLLKYFALTLAFLIVIYQIFTAFELWKFVGGLNNGVGLLFLYLLYLIPFVYIQIAPSALMIATLATYVIKSRQNEVVTWTASGQSIYRLLLPCFVLMMFIGVINWGIQENVLPYNNRVQDELRNKIRSQGASQLAKGKNWVATENRIYSFELPDDQALNSVSRRVKNLIIYQLDEKGGKLISVTNVGEALWEEGSIKFLSGGNRVDWLGDKPHKLALTMDSLEIKENYNPFGMATKKPNHLTTAEMSEYVKTTESETEKRTYSVALQKRYSTIFLPLIITLFTAPFALSLSRKGKVMTVGYAVGVWLLFIGITSFFEQFGTNGYLDARIAVWSPLVLFTVLGFFLLSKVKT